MKVYLHYNHPDDESLNMTIKLTLPKSWKTGPVEQLLEVFLESYNKKNPTNELNFVDHHFQDKDNVPFAYDAVVEQFVDDRQDLFLVAGEAQSMEELGYQPRVKEATPVKSSSAPTVVRKPVPKSTNNATTLPKETNSDPSLLVCKHFGCSKRYKEEDNHDTHCRYHEKPPVFHETRKWWACCPKKIAYDWETFTAIPGCKVGRCTDIDPAQRFMGGSDVRAAAEYEFAPKRIDAQAPAPVEKKADGLTTLMNLRKGLIAVGVPGAAFDSARDHLKAKHEDMGVKVWDKVTEELAAEMTKMLESLNSK